MSQKRVKYLISLMLLALAGIIVIQYLWIDNALNERQKMVDHQVYQAVANVEQQMANHESLAIVATDFFDGWVARRGICDEFCSY